MISNSVNYNFNFNFSGTTSGNAGVTGGLVSGNNLLDRIDKLLSQVENLFNSLGSGSNNITAGGCYGHNAPTLPAPVEPPVVEESAQPAGSLKVDGGKITTAGGYTIEATNQFEWKITGPDGKSTRVWGDPHVDEGDGGKWDFKKNSTFVLGDGTKINVNTVPFGNGATVTGSLEVISGNDRVQVSDIDKGQGKIGEVTKDGFAHANSFQGDVFVQGKETDDWTKDGREVIGSDNQGETQKLGDKMDVGTTGVNNGRALDQMFGQFTAGLLTSLLRSALQNALKDMFRPQNFFGSNPLAGNTRPAWETGRKPFDSQVYRGNLTDSFRQLSRMFDILSRLSSLQDRLSNSRNYTAFV